MIRRIVEGIYRDHYSFPFVISTRIKQLAYNIGYRRVLIPDKFRYNFSRAMLDNKF